MPTSSITSPFGAPGSVEFTPELKQQLEIAYSIGQHPDPGASPSEHYDYSFTGILLAFLRVHDPPISTHVSTGIAIVIVHGS